MSQLKLAILGAGGIAETMAETVRQMDDVCLYAVAAREEARAKAFAETYGAEHYYGSYEEMLQDDGVELVYIATPHSHMHSMQSFVLSMRAGALREGIYLDGGRGRGSAAACKGKAGIYHGGDVGAVYADVPDAEGDG